MSTVVEAVRATELSPMVGCRNNQLADGSFLYRVSVWPEWVYVQALRPDGRFVKRRYRPAQMVKVRG